MKYNSHVYILTFNDPIKHTGLYAFSSLTAIYDVFTPYEVGLTLGSLWNKKIKVNHPYHGKRCSIVQLKVKSKKQAVK